MKTHTKDWIVVGVIVVVLILAFSYFIYNLGDQNQTEEVVKIGVIVPLTGEYTTLGNRIKNGMELAKTELEKENDFSIEIIYEDVCLGNDAIPAVRKLTDIDRVSWIGGSFCVVGLIPNIPILEQKKIISFNTAANPDMMLNHPYVFSTNKAIKDDAKEIAEFAINNLNAKTTSVIYYNTPLGVDYGKYYIERFEELGGEVLLDEAYELNQKDFRTELIKIKNSNPDVIFVIGLAGPMGNFIKQTQELDIDSQILSFSEIEDPNVLKIAGKAAEGLIISSAEPSVITEDIHKFKEDYKSRFEDEPDVLAANSYDALHLQILVYKKCNGETECMTKELHNIKDYPGVSGVITIQEDGSSLKPNLYKIVRNGEFVKYEDSEKQKSKLKKPIKIGAIQPLTGKVSYVGEWVREGIDLAVEDLKKQGKDIEIIYEDDACDPKKAVSSINKLINVNKVGIVIGPTCSSSVLSIAPIAEENKVIIFSTVATSSKITHAGDYIFRNRESDEIHGKTMAEFAFNTLGARKTGILFLNLDNGIAFKDSFKTRFSELGGEITAEESYELKDLDFKTQLTKIKNSNPDVLYFAGQRMENAILQARELEIKEQILGPSTIQNDALLMVAGRAAEGIIYTYPDISSEESEDYQNSYKNKYGRNSEAYAANSYDAVKILVKAIESCNNDKNTDCIKSFLYSIKNYKGVSGNFEFDKNGDVNRPLLVKTIKNGEFVKYEN